MRVCFYFFIFTMRDSKAFASEHQKNQKWLKNIHFYSQSHPTYNIFWNKCNRFFHPSLQKNRKKNRTVKWLPAIHYSTHINCHESKNISLKIYIDKLTIYLYALSISIFFLFPFYIHLCCLFFTLTVYSFHSAAFA